MSGQITHSWNGTVLTITSDAGTTSMDLKGDTGCRGAQGPAGVVYGPDGEIILEGYATEEYVESMLQDVNLEGYATEAFVNEKIQYGTEDLVAGSSALATGTIYVVYEG